MADPQIVCPEIPRSAPDVARSVLSSGRELPEDILRQASSRLSITALLIAVTYVAMNLLTDLAYGLLDPRIRYE